MVRIAVVLLLVLAGSALAQDCVDWTETMPPPVEYPEIRAGKLQVVGDLLVSFSTQSINVYRVSADHQVDLLGVAPISGQPWRTRVIDGMIYCLKGPGGLFRVDLSDPTDPAMVTLYDPVASLRDLAAFDGGFAILADDTLYAVDQLDGSPPSILSTVAMDAEEIVAAGSCVYACGERLSVVDFSDVVHPVFDQGEGHYPGDHPYMTAIMDGMIVNGNRLYLSAYYWGEHAYDEDYLIAFDITVPSTPKISTVRELDGSTTQNVVLCDQYIVRSGLHDLEFFRLGDFEYMATVDVGPCLGKPVACGDQIFAKASHDGTLHRLDCSHVAVVHPVAWLRHNYYPLDCGPIGFASRAVYHEHPYDAMIDSLGWQLFDQSDPLNPTVITEHMLDAGVDPDFPCGFSTSFLADNDRWAVVTFRENCDSYILQSIHVYDKETWELASIDVPPVGQVVLVGDVLWVWSNSFCFDDKLIAYQLSPGGISLLDQIEVPNGAGCFVIGEDVCLLVDDLMQVYDRNSPGAITLIEEHSLAPITGLYQRGRHNSEFLYCLTLEGFAVIDLQPSSPTSPVVRSFVNLVEPDSRLTWNGDRVMVHGNDGYQVLDVSDPDAISVVTDLVPLSVGHAIWNGNHLYAGSLSDFHLYDMSDPSSPVWLGQGRGGTNIHGPCVRDGYLMMGQAVFPPDCLDPTPIQGDPDAPDSDVDLPPRAVLHPAVPNPFNPQTTLRFTLATRQHVDLDVYDARGRRITRLLSRTCEGGIHRVHWTGLDQGGRPLSSGTYLVRLRTETDVRTQKVVLVR